MIIKRVPKNHHKNFPRSSALEKKSLMLRKQGRKFILKTYDKKRLNLKAGRKMKLILKILNQFLLYFCEISANLIIISRRTKTNYVG